MKTITLAFVLILTSTPVIAEGSGDHVHDGSGRIGQPSGAAEADRTIEIRMVEADEGMGFEPSELEVEEGETIRFAVSNAGYLEHEIALGTQESNLIHKEEMAKMGQMEHEDPNALRLAPDEQGEIVWTFPNTGTYQFACLIPGQMEAGMHGSIAVN